MPHAHVCPGCEAGIVTGQPPVCDGCGLPYLYARDAREEEGEPVPGDESADEILVVFSGGVAVGAMIMGACWFILGGGL